VIYRFLTLFEFVLVPDIIWVGQGTSIRLKDTIPQMIKDRLYETAFLYSPARGKLYVTDGFHASILRNHAHEDGGPALFDDSKKVYGRALQGLVQVYVKSPALIPMPLMVALRMLYGTEARIVAAHDDDYNPTGTEVYWHQKGGTSART
jgi:hypothetical protein